MTGLFLIYGVWFRGNAPVSTNGLDRGSEEVLPEKGWRPQNRVCILIIQTLEITLFGIAIITVEFVSLLLCEKQEI